MIKVGCCGFPKAKKKYDTHSPVVEVQQTFYHPPRVGTCEMWQAQASPGFEFIDPRGVRRIAHRTCSDQGQ